MARAVIRREGIGHLFRGSAWVMLGFVVQALTGSVFWLAAAGLHPAADIGLAAALFSSIQFVNYVSGVGLQELLSRFHRDPSQRLDPLFTGAVLTTAVGSGIATVVYLAVVSSDALEIVRDLGPAGFLLFWGLSAGGAIALLVDVRMMAARRWGAVFTRLTLAGLARLPLLFVPVPLDDALWLFVVIIGPIAVSGYVGLLAVPRLTGARLGLRPRPEPMGEIVRYASANWLAELSVLAPQFVLPVIVLVNVTPEENANFFLAWTIASVAFMLPVTVGRVLLVESSGHGAGGAPAARPALALAVGVMLVALAGSFVVRPLIVSFYGEVYRLATTLLPGLILGGIPWGITSISLSRARARHDHLTTVVTAGTLALGVILIAAVLVRDAGAEGAVRAWILANSLAALVALGLSSWRTGAGASEGASVSRLPEAEPSDSRSAAGRGR